MTKLEFINANREVLRECLRFGVSVSDVRNADIYGMVQRLKGRGLKVEACVSEASACFGISPATVWRIMRDMDAPLRASSV